MENLTENGTIQRVNPKTEYIAVKHQHMWNKQSNIDVSGEDEE